MRRERLENIIMTCKMEEYARQGKAECDKMIHWLNIETLTSMMSVTKDHWT